jgi:hypothetical protein
MRDQFRVRRAATTAFIAFVILVFRVEVGDAENAPAREIVSIPFANPLKGFDASTLAWNGVTQVFDASTRFVATAGRLDGSVTGRLAYLAIASYFDYATDYYSHETAHFLHQKTDKRHFWLNLDDWSRLVPAFRLTKWTDCWDPRELHAYALGLEPGLDARVRRWLVLMGESGLYQEKVNARYIALSSSLAGNTTISSAISFVINHTGDVTYNFLADDGPRTSTRTNGYNLFGENDISAYARVMGEMGFTISRNDWLASSLLAFAASGQTWNSTAAACRYLTHGTRSVGNLTWSISDRIALSPPNFYLFPTYRGLYLESETRVGVSSQSEKQFHVVLGTGLDAFGLNQVGAVDRVRVGGRYDAFDLDLQFATFSFSPYCYADLDRSFRHRGQSLGAEVACPVGARFSLRADIEYNRNDVVEGIIKNKDEGMYFLLAAGFNLDGDASGR